MEIKHWWCFEVSSRLEDRPELPCIPVSLIPQVQLHSPFPLPERLSFCSFFCLVCFLSLNLQLSSQILPFPIPSSGVCCSSLSTLIALTGELITLFLKIVIESVSLPWPWFEIRGNLVFPVPGAVPHTYSAPSESFLKGRGNQSFIRLETEVMGRAFQEEGTCTQVKRKKRQRLTHTRCAKES